MKQPYPWEFNTESVAAVCDAWAIDSGNRRHHRGGKGLVLVSLAAPMSTVKGIRGMINGASNKVATLIPLHHAEDDARTPVIQRELSLLPLRKGRQFQRRLSSLNHYHHCVIMTPDTTAAPVVDEEEETSTNATDTFYVFCRDPDAGPQALYRQFIRRSPTPTLPEWAEFIWETAEDRNQLKPLLASGIAAWRCDINYDDMETAIVNALRRGRLPLP